MTKRQEQKELTRKSILETAIKVFAKHGIMQTRMSDIAEAAGIAHGSVFAHYKSQEDLVSAVIEEFSKRTALRTHELAEARSGLREILSAHLTGLQENEDFYIRLISEAALLPQSAKDSLTGIQSAVSFHISSSLQTEINAGKIKPISLHLLFNTWVGLIHYYLMNQNLFAPGESVLKRYGAILLDHFMNLISK